MKGVGIFCALLTGFCFGIGGAVSALVGNHGFNVFQTCFAQFAFSTVVLGILTAVKYRSAISLRDVLKLLGLGIIEAVALVTYYAAIRQMSVAAGVAMQFQYVWMAVVIQSIIGRKLPGKWSIISAVMIIAGAVLGSGLADEFCAGHSTVNLLGMTYAIVCAFTYALFICGSGAVAQACHPIQQTFVISCGCLLTMSAALALFGGGFGFDYVGIIQGGVALGMLTTVLPLVSIAVATAALPGSAVAILASSELPVAVASGAVMLGECVTPLVVVGVLMILAAIALSQLDSRVK